MYIWIETGWNKQGYDSKYNTIFYVLLLNDNAHENVCQYKKASVLCLVLNRLRTPILLKYCWKNAGKFEYLVAFN